MRAMLAIIPVSLLLSACVDPLAGMERMSDGIDLPHSNVATVFPTQDELDRETSVLSDLLRKEQETSGGIANADEKIARNDPIEPNKQVGLFGRAGSSLPTAGLSLREVSITTRLPFGEVGRVCGVRRSELGQRIEQAARKGSDYALYDSAPGGVGPRTFYVTGFKDNCARQFTASLALFGSPEFHEQLRYGLPAKEYPYSTTDQAYEKVKKRVCRVGQNTPCGTRINRLKNTTVFISVYENFQNNARWADMLLHDGALLASAVKTP